MGHIYSPAPYSCTQRFPHQEYLQLIVSINLTTFTQGVHIQVRVNACCTKSIKQTDVLCYQKLVSHFKQMVLLEQASLTHSLVSLGFSLQFPDLHLLVRLSVPFPHVTGHDHCSQDDQTTTNILRMSKQRN